MNLRNLRSKLGPVVAFALLTSVSGCGSNPKKSLKVDGQTYPECSLAVISDFNLMARTYSRATEGGLSSREQEARLADLEKELTVFYERHVGEGNCAARVQDSDEVQTLKFPENREVLEAQVKAVMDRIREKQANA